MEEISTTVSSGYTRTYGLKSTIQEHVVGQWWESDLFVPLSESNQANR